VRRLLVAAILVVLAACGGDDGTSSNLGALIENSKTANVRLTYTNADGSFRWLVSQTGADYLAFFTEDEKSVSTPDGTFDCVAMDTETPTCTEIAEADLEFTPFGPSAVISFQNTIARHPDLLEGSPAEIRIADRMAQCYSVDPDRLLPGSGVVDPDARLCVDPGSGWVLEASAVDEEGGIYFRATKFEAPENSDYVVPVEPTPATPATTATTAG
jgi:hypothetical protein